MHPTTARCAAARDIFATAAALSGVKSTPERPLDGVNLIPFLTGENKGAPHESIYLRKFDQGVFAVRHGDSKLVISKTDATPQLFNLATDLGEARNIAKDQPENLAEIETLRKQWNAQLIEPAFEGLKPPPGRKKSK